MKVLKFGGTSVANSKNIKRVASIVTQIKDAQTIVVVSALGGVTDLLLETATLASLQDEKYTKIFQKIENRHLTTIKELLPIKKQSSILSKVKSELNTLETLLEGAFLIGEITPKLSDKIVSYGEILSSYIISEYLISQKIAAVYADSRAFIITDDAHGNASVHLRYKEIQQPWEEVDPITLLR